MEILIEFERFIGNYFNIEKEWTLNPFKHPNIDQIQIKDEQSIDLIKLLKKSKNIEALKESFYFENLSKVE